MSLRTYSSIFLLVILALVNVSCSNHKPTATESVSDTLSEVDMNQRMIDSLKAMPVITQQDIDFIMEHTTNDGDYYWCFQAELDLQYDSLRRMREEIQKSPEHQEIAKLFDEEWELFQKYRDASRDAYFVCEEIDQIGSASARAISISSIDQSCYQEYALADKDALSQLCGDNPRKESHRKITQSMIDAAYAQMIDSQEDGGNNCSRKVKQDHLRKEKEAWTKWMAYRTAMSKRLPNDVRTYFDNATNNTMRHKLISLKNQYQNLGVISGDIERCWLPQNCSDDDLLKYPSFHHIWEIYLQHLDDAQWTDWKRSLIYK